METLPVPGGLAADIKVTTSDPRGEVGHIQNRTRLRPRSALRVDKTASRTAKWAQFERHLGALTNAIQCGFIVLFIIMIIIGWTGRPYVTPAVVAASFWCVLILSALRLFMPTFKNIFVGAGPKPSKKEVVVTIAVSSACVFTAVMLALYGRGFNGYLPVGTHDWQRAVMVWTYWVFKFFLMHMYGIVAGNALLLILFTGCCFGFCCNCCCRGPIYRTLLGGGRAFKARRARVKGFKAVKAAEGSGSGSGASSRGGAGGGHVVHISEQRTSQLPAKRVAELEQRFEGLLHPTEASSKDEPEPIIDFVENKAQIGILTPLIFIFAFAMGSAIVMCGSALVGPENTLGLRPRAPVRITALCASPVHELITDTLAQLGPATAKLGAKRAYVGALLAWKHLLEPTTDICADIVRNDAEVEHRILKLYETGQLTGENPGAEVRKASARVDELERARRWMVSAELPSAGGEVEVPALHMAVHDERTIGVPGRTVAASVFKFHNGTCGAGVGSTPTLVSGATNTTDALGMVSMVLRLDVTGCTAGEVLIRLDTPTMDSSSGLAHNLTRYATVWLYAPTSATYSDSLQTVTTTQVDNYTDVTVVTDIRYFSNATTRTQLTNVNQTTLKYVNASRTQVDTTSSTYLSSLEVVPSNVLFVLLSPPPANVSIRERFDVVVSVQTSHGIPLPGIDVTAILLAPNGSNAKLEGQRRGFSDADGLVTLTMWFQAGRSTITVVEKGKPKMKNLYTLLVSSSAVMQSLKTKGAITNVVSQKAKEMNNVVASTASTQLLARRRSLTTGLQTDLQKTMQADSQKATDDAAKAAQACVATSSAAAVADPAAAANVRADLEACINTAIQGSINNLQASVTKTVTDTVSSEAGGLAGVDTNTLVNQLQPVLQQALMTAVGQVPGLQTITSQTGIPSSQAELLTLATSVGLASWSLLPFPAPINVRLTNGLDSPTAPRVLANFNELGVPQYVDNGAYFNAPIVGYALSESSEATNVVSGMSSCTLEGYARVEPSPRGIDYFMMLGLWDFPKSIIPAWTGAEQDEVSSYFSSALWQPFPFNNFNFMFDVDEATADTKDTRGCKRTYMTRGSSFPWMNVDPAWNFDPGCPGASYQCSANIPDKSGSWGSPAFLQGTTPQPRSSPCKHELIRTFGPDSLPSVSMLENGGMQTLAQHLECVGCFEQFMGQECPAAVYTTSRTPTGGGLPNDTWALLLDQETCDRFFAGAKRKPGYTLGRSYKDLVEASLTGQSEEVRQMYMDSKPLQRFLKLTSDSGWNGCYSDRFNRNKAGWTRPNDIRKFNPDVTFNVYFDGKQIFKIDELINAPEGGYPQMEIRDRNPEAVWEWLPLQVSSLFMGALGRFSLALTTIERGGSRRDLDLEMLIDGVPVQNANDSWWKFDNTLHYVDPDSISFDKLLILFLTGHDAFRLFALRRIDNRVRSVLTIPVFYLNMHGRRKRMPGLLPMVLGGLVAWLFIWYTGTILRHGARTETPPFFSGWGALSYPSVHRLLPILAFGENDLVAITSLVQATPLQRTAILAVLVVVAAPMCLCLIDLSLRWLVGEFIRPFFPKRVAALHVKLEKQGKKKQQQPPALMEKSTDTSGAAASQARALDLPSAGRRQLLKAFVMNGCRDAPLPTRSEAYDGFPEEGSWLESDYAMRMRCARNHVRRLLRGRGWYEAQLLMSKVKKSKKRPSFPLSLLRGRSSKVGDNDGKQAEGGAVVESSREGASAPVADTKPEVIVKFKKRRAPLETSEAFFFPQRLKMACALSLWISLMLSLIFTNICSWGVAVLSAAGHLDAVMTAQAPVSDQIHAATMLADKPIVMLTILSALGVQVPLESEGAATLSIMVGWVMVFGLLTLLLTVVGQWFFIFQNFKSDSFELRRGAYFFDKALFREEYANKYIGFQVAHMTVSFMVITVLYVIVAVIVTPIVLSLVGALGDDRKLWNQLVDIVFGLLLPSSVQKMGLIIPLCGTILFQLVMNRKVFFVGTAANAWLRWPFWYGLFDYNLLYTNAMLGLTVCVARLAMLFVFFVLFLARLDKTTMPGPRGGFINLDAGYKAYIGMLRLDHRYNNPVFLTFGEIVLDRLRMTRIKASLRKIRRMHIRRVHGDPEMAATPEEARRIVLKTKFVLWCIRIMEHEHDRAFCRCVNVRNKWQLAWRLMQQPELRKCRTDAALKLQLKADAVRQAGRR